MIVTEYFSFAHLADLRAHMLELPYMGGQLCFQVILPEGDRAMASLERDFLNIDLQHMFDSAKRQEKVAVSIPRFKLEQTLDLKESLQGIGIKDIFISDAADLSGIDGTRNLFISKVAQRIIPF